MAGDVCAVFTVRLYCGARALDRDPEGDLGWRVRLAQIPESPQEGDRPPKPYAPALNRTEGSRPRTKQPPRTRLFVVRNSEAPSNANLTPTEELFRMELLSQCPGSLYQRDGEH